MKKEHKTAVYSTGFIGPGRQTTDWTSDKLWFNSRQRVGVEVEGISLLQNMQTGLEPSSTFQLSVFANWVLFIS